MPKSPVSGFQESASMQIWMELIRKQSILIESLQKTIEGLNLKLERFEHTPNVANVVSDISVVLDDVDKDVVKIVKKDVTKKVIKYKSLDLGQIAVVFQLTHTYNTHLGRT